MATRGDNVKALLGLAIACVIVPAVYAGLAYWYVVQYGSRPPKNDPLLLAILIAFPLVISGFPKWWDVWIVPSPKLGSPWRSYSPAEFVSDTVKLNTIGIVACVVVHLLFNQLIANEVATSTLTLNVGQAKARLNEVEAKLGGAQKRHANARERSARSSFPADDFGRLSADPFFADDEKRQASVEIEQLTWERESLASQIRDHEQKVKVLEAAKKHPGDRFSSLAFMCLFGSAFYFSCHSPVNKKFHSGQPIRRG